MTDDVARAVGSCLVGPAARTSTRKEERKRFFIIVARQRTFYHLPTLRVSACPPGPPLPNRASPRWPRYTYLARGVTLYAFGRHATMRLKFSSAFEAFSICI